MGVITRWLLLQIPRISSDLTELFESYDIGYPDSEYRLLRCNCLCTLLSPLSNLCTLLCKKHARPLIPSVRPVSYETKCAHGNGVTAQVVEDVALHNSELAKARAEAKEREADNARE